MCVSVCLFLYVFVVLYRKKLFYYVYNSQMSEVSVLSTLRNVIFYYGNDLLQVKSWLDKHV